MTLKESRRIKGKSLGFKLDGLELWPDMSGCSLDPIDSDDTTTFGSLQAGGTPMQLKVSGITSTQKGSLWRTIFDHVGETVPFMFSPNGNETASPDRPHFVGEVAIEKPAGIGSQVNETSTFELELSVDSWSLFEGTGTPTDGD